MIKTIALIALIVVGANAVCQDTLITAMGFTPQTAAALTSPDYCENLQESGALSCCTQADVDGIQTKLTALITSLETDVGVRDVLIETARKETVPEIKDKFVTASANAQLVITAIGSTSGYTDRLVVLNAIKAWNSNINTINNIAQARYSAYQTSRSTCVKKLLTLQAAAWCLACEDGAGSLGVSSDAIALSTATSEEVITACLPYLTYNEFQNSILYYSYIEESDLDSLITLLDTAADASDANLSDAVDDVVTAYEALAPQGLSTASAHVVVPDSCDEDDCDFLTTDIWDGGVIDEVLLSNGGSEVVYNNGVRLLQSIIKSNDRMLQGTWVPANFASGATVTFSNNPGDVDVSGGLRQGALIGSILAVLAVLLF